MDCEDDHDEEDRRKEAWNRCIRGSSMKMGFGMILGAIGSSLMGGSELPLQIMTGLASLWSVNSCVRALRARRAAEVEDAAVQEEEECPEQEEPPDGGRVCQREEDEEEYLRRQMEEQTCVDDEDDIPCTCDVKNTWTTGKMDEESFQKMLEECAGDAQAYGLHH